MRTPRLYRIFPHGYVGVALLFAGIYAMTRGVAYLPLFVPGPGEIPGGLALLENVMPITMWGGAWALGGLVAALRAFSKTLGFAWGVVLGLMTAWGLAYGLGWMVSIIQGEPNREWVSMLSYLGPALVISFLLLAGPKRGRE